MTEVKQGWERILYGVDYVTPRLNGGGGGGLTAWQDPSPPPFSPFTPSVLLPPSLNLHGSKPPIIMSSSKSGNASSKRGWQVPWDIRPKNLFLIHASPSNDEGGTSAELLAECTAAGRLSGGFRWAFGGGNINAGFALGCVVDLPDAPQFFVNIDMKPDEIDLRNNNSSGKWADLMDWIAEGKVAITSNDDASEVELLGKLFSISQYKFSVRAAVNLLKK